MLTEDPTGVGLEVLVGEPREAKENADVRAEEKVLGVKGRRGIGPGEEGVLQSGFCTVDDGEKKSG